MSRSKNIIRNRYVFAAAFAALIAISTVFVFPIPGPVPIVLRNLFVILAGTILGSFYGGISALIFIFAGIIGLPLFVVPGVGAFSTPLGGFIIGYFFGSLAAGLICGVPKISEKKITALFAIRLSAASLLGFLIILFCGVFYAMLFVPVREIVVPAVYDYAASEYTEAQYIFVPRTFSSAMAALFLPFIIGDAIKWAVSIPLALKLRPIAARYLNGD